MKYDNEILRDLASDDNQIITKAFLRIGNERPEGGWELLLPFLWNDSAKVKENAIYFLSDFANQTILSRLLVLVKQQPDDQIHLAIWCSLQRYFHPDILKLIQDDLLHRKSQDAAVIWMAQYLSRYPSEVAISLLLLIISFNSKNTIVFAVVSLYLLNSNKLKDTWQELVNHEHEYVAGIAKKALQQLEENPELFTSVSYSFSSSGLTEAQLAGESWLFTQLENIEQSLKNFIFLHEARLYLDNECGYCIEEYNRPVSDVFTMLKGCIKESTSFKKIIFDLRENRDSIDRLMEIEFLTDVDKETGYFKRLPSVKIRNYVMENGNDDLIQRICESLQIVKFDSSGTL